MPACKLALITDNKAAVVYVNNDSEKLNMTECTLGDTTFENKNMVEGVGSLLGEGSVSMVMSILALAASAASIGVSIALYKKKTLPVADNAEEDDE